MEKFRHTGWLILLAMVFAVMGGLIAWWVFDIRVALFCAVNGLWIGWITGCLTLIARQL